jgi:hypothetical protein
MATLLVSHEVGFGAADLSVHPTRMRWQKPSVRSDQIVR